MVLSFIVACKRGLFGIDCHETCGHCRDINECSNVHGTCLTGCADGYEGNLCNARKYTVTCTTKAFLYKSQQATWKIIVIKKKTILHTL